MLTANFSGLLVPRRKSLQLQVNYVQVVLFRSEKEFIPSRSVLYQLQSNSLIHPFLAMIWLLHDLRLLLRKSDTRPPTSLIQGSLSIPLRPPGLGIGLRDRASCAMQPVKETQCAKVHGCLGIERAFMVQVMLAWIVPARAVACMTQDGACGRGHEPNI